jgi:hypothetical protein
MQRIKQLCLRSCRVCGWALATCAEARRMRCALRRERRMGSWSAA